MKCLIAAALTAAVFYPLRTPAQTPEEKPAPVKATRIGDLWFKARQDCRADSVPCEADCNNGNPFACSSMSGKYLSKENYDQALAVKFAEKACNTGDAMNCLEAGWKLFYIFPKKQKNIPDQARRLFALACEKQDARGCEFAKSVDAGTMPARVEPGDDPPPPPNALCSMPPSSGASSPTAEPSQLLTEVEVNEPPKLISRSEPKYPKKMLMDGVNGKVFLLIVVDDKGKVAGQTVLESTNDVFAQAAQAAVSQWRYQPGKRCGTPVSVIKSVAVFFKQG